MPPPLSAIDRAGLGKPWYAHRWPWFLMAGPLLVMLAAIPTAWLAFTRQDALVVDDYYKEGNAINQDLRRDRAAQALGLEMQLHYDASAGRLIGTLVSRGQPYPGKLWIKLVHSTLPSKDIALDAQVDERGNFSVALPMLEMARWQVHVEGAQRNWRLNGVWHWPQQSQIAIQPGLDG